MIQTATGYKVLLANPVKDTMDGINSVNQFFADMREESLWYAITGQTFPEWFVDTSISFLHWLVNVSDILMLSGVVILLLIMFGSKRAQKWLYWNICIYLLFQIVGLMV